MITEEAKDSTRNCYPFLHLRSGETFKGSSDNGKSTTQHKASPGGHTDGWGSSLALGPHSLGSPIHLGVMAHSHNVVLGHVLTNPETPGSPSPPGRPLDSALFELPHHPALGSPVSAHGPGPTLHISSIPRAGLYPLHTHTHWLCCTLACRNS